MNKSESIIELAKALALAQAEMKGAVKDSLNPFFKSAYSDLTSVWDAIREPFTKNGLSFVQAVNFDSSFPDMVFVETTMLHTSGEYIAGNIGMKPVKQDPQSVGSCITYCRRYGLQALSGVAPEDDDGNAASAANGKKNTTPPPTTPPKADPGASGEPPRLISDEQRKRFFTIARKSGKSDEEIKSQVYITTGQESSKLIPVESYEELCRWAENSPQ